MRRTRLAGTGNLICLFVAVFALAGSTGCATQRGARDHAVETAPAPIRHVVLFALKPDVSPAQRKVIEDASAALLEDTGLIRAYEWGADLNSGQRAQGFTHCVIMTFDSADSLKRYLVHPAHVAFKEKALPFMEKMLVVDFQPQFTPAKGT